MHAGAQRLVTALGVMNFDAGTRVRRRRRQHRPEGRSAARRAEEGRPTWSATGGRSTAGGWHFLTGTEASIKRLADAVGFRYAYDEEIEQFAHGAAIEVLTPKGMIASYFYGIEYSPRDIRLGLIEASEERIGTPIDDVLLLCYHYDPATGKYGAAVARRLVRTGRVSRPSSAFLSFLFVSLRRERARAA